MANLTNQYISSSYDDLLQIDVSGTVTDGLGAQPNNFVFTDATASNLNVTSNVNSDLIPGEDDLHDLGSLSNRWDNVHASNFSGSFEGYGGGLTGVTSTPAPAGIDTQIQFNDNGSTGAESTFTFDKVTGGVTAISFTGSLQGTSSYAEYADYAVSASYADSASVAITALTASSVDWNSVNSIPGGLISGSAQLENSNFSGSFSGSFEGNGSGLTGIISSSYSVTSSYVEWSNVVNITDTLLSGSAQISTEISGAFSNDSSSIEIRLTSLEGNQTGLWSDSGSYITRTSEVQITGSLYVSNSISANIVSASEIAASSVSASVYYGYGGLLTGINATSIDWTDVQNKPTVLSGSTQIGTEISGAFSNDSSSIEIRLTTLETSGVDNASSASYVEWTDVVNKPTVLSSSFQIASDISGSFTEASNSIASDINTIQSQTIYNNVGSQFSGSFSGSFFGDGTGLTGVVSEWDGTRDGNAIITGSLLVSGSFNFVDFNNVLQVQGKQFSGSYIGDGTQLVFDNQNQQFTGSFSGDGTGLTLSSENVVNVVRLNPTTSLQTISESVAIVDNLTVGGTLIADTVQANTYIISSSVSDITINYSSGSTAFGDSLDDTHVFTGSVYVTNSLHVDGTVSGTTLSGSSLTVTTAAIDNLTASGSLSGSFVGDVTFTTDIVGSGSFSGSFFGDGTGLTGMTLGAAGNDRSIQFNNGGITNGASSFSYNNSTSIVKVSNKLEITGSLGNLGTTTLSGTTTIKGGDGQNAGIYVVDNSAGNKANPLTNGANGIFVNTSGGTFTTLVKNSVAIGGTRTGEFLTRDNTVYLPNVELWNASGSFSGSFQGEGSGVTGVVSSSYTVSSSYAVTSSYAAKAGGFTGGLATATAGGGDTTDAVDLQGGLTASAVQIGNIPQYQIPYVWLRGITKLKMSTRFFIF